MIDTLPFYLRKSGVLNEVFDSEQHAINFLETKANDIVAQMNIDTATWGLDIFEREFGIQTDLSKSYDDRRSVIKLKWRGSGKVDGTLIKLAADAYTNGDVVVTFENGEIIVKFNSVFGIPKNLDDLKNNINEIKPAHLNVTYTFRYTLWADIDAENHTWQHISMLNNTWEQVENGGLLNGNNNS